MTLGGLPNPMEIFEQVKREEEARRQSEEAAQREAEAQREREEAERRERERQERERKIRQEREKLQSQLADASNTRAQVEAKAAEAAKYAQSLAASLQAAITGLIAATNGTHVGTSQFCAAASSALSKATAIQRALSDPENGYRTLSGDIFMSGGGGGAFFSTVTSGGGGGGSSSETMIHVAPEIAAGRSEVSQAGTDTFFVQTSLTMYFALVANQSNALKTAASKMMGFSGELKTLASQLGRMASDITTVYDNYHTAQQNAIYLAEMIPR